jgi:hypothetical protein
MPDFLVMCLLGYGLLQAALLSRLNGQIRTQSFTLSHWGFSFGLAALGWSVLSVAPSQAATHFHADVGQPSPDRRGHRQMVQGEGRLTLPNAASLLI